MSDLIVTNPQLAAQLANTTAVFYETMAQQFYVMGTEPDGGEYGNGHVWVASAPGGAKRLMKSIPTVIAEFSGPVANAQAAYELANSIVLQAGQHASNAAGSADSAADNAAFVLAGVEDAADHAANALVYANNALTYRNDIQANVVVLHQAVDDLANAVDDQAELVSIVSTAQAVVTVAQATVLASESNVIDLENSVTSNTAIVLTKAGEVASNTTLVLTANTNVNSLAATVANNTATVLTKAGEVAADTAATAAANTNVNSKAATVAVQAAAVDDANTNVNLKHGVVVAAEANVIELEGSVSANTAIVLIKAAEADADAAAAALANTNAQAAKVIAEASRDIAVSNAVAAAGSAEDAFDANAAAWLAVAEATEIVGGDYLLKSSKATTLDAEAGVNDALYMTPAKTKAAITALAGAATSQFSIPITATGVEQTVDLGVEVDLSELLIFENGLEQDGTGFVIDGSELTFTRPSGTHLRIMLSGGYRGRSYEPDVYGNSIADRDLIDIANSGVGLTFLDMANGVFYFSNTIGWSEGVTLRGPQGDQGIQGNPGVDGEDGVGVAHATIADGWLTLTYSNAAVANVGYVVGPQGEQGIQGPPGANGSNGTSVVYSTNLPKHLGTANSVGVANVAAREDHVHQFPLATASNTIVVANSIITLTDHGRVVDWDMGNAALILPNDMPAGFNCLIYVANSTGVPTFTPQSGATIRQADSYTKARKQHSEVSARVRSNANGVAAVWVLSGDMQ